MHPAFLLPLLMILATPVQAQTVLVVDASGGAGSDFTSLQAAVAAAAVGDTLLVRPGAYAGVGFDQGITVVADGGPVDVLDLAVTALPAGQTVTLRGINVTEGPGVSPYNLRLRQCDGTVVLEDCQILHAPVPFQSGGVLIDDCASVIMSHCFIEPPDESLANILVSLSIQDGSHVLLFDTEVGGGSPETIDDGGTAIYVDSSFLGLSACTVYGGDGGDGFLFVCNGGDGGDGLVVDAQSEVLLIDTVITGGVGGQPGIGQLCFPGDDGQDLVNLGGTVVEHTQTQARQLTTSSPAREGQPLTLTFDNVGGVTGDFLWLGVSTQASGLVSNPAKLFPSLHVLVTPLFIELGPPVPGGTLTLTPTVPDLGPGVATVTLYLQGLFFDITAGVFIPSAPSTAMVLDSAF